MRSTLQNMRSTLQRLAQIIERGRFGEACLLGARTPIVPDIQFSLGRHLAAPPFRVGGDCRRSTVMGPPGRLFWLFSQETGDQGPPPLVRRRATPIFVSAPDLRVRLLSSHGDGPPLFSSHPLFAGCKSGPTTFGITEEAAEKVLEPLHPPQFRRRADLQAKDRPVQVGSRGCAGSCRRVLHCYLS